MELSNGLEAISVILSYLFLSLMKLVISRFCRAPRDLFGRYLSRPNHCQLLSGWFLFLAMVSHLSFFSEGWVSYIAFTLLSWGFETV